jgi:phospholipase/carboxylesterase
MELEHHQGNRLLYVTVYPDGYDPSRRYPVVILLHGFGAGMDDLAGLSPAIDRQGYVFVFPNGPQQVLIGPGTVGYSWSTPGGFSDPEEGRKGQELVDEFVEEVRQEYGVEPGRLVLGGFSQGAGLTYRSGLRRPDLFAGLVLLSGAIGDAEQLAEFLPPERTQPLFIAHGVSDPMIPVERARQARDFLQAAGYDPEYHEYPMAHEISQELIDHLTPWLHRVLPPAPLLHLPGS